MALGRGGRQERERGHRTSSETRHHLRLVPSSTTGPHNSGLRSGCFLSNDGWVMSAYPAGEGKPELHLPARIHTRMRCVQCRWTRLTWFQVSVLPVACCMTLGPALNLSELSFLPLHMELSSLCLGIWRVNMVCLALSTCLVCTQYGLCCCIKFSPNQSAQQAPSCLPLALCSACSVLPTQEAGQMLSPLLDLICKLWFSWSLSFFSCRMGVVVPSRFLRRRIAHAHQLVP